MMHNCSRFGDISCVVANRDIEAGEEIFTNYGKGKEDKLQNRYLKYFFEN